MKTPLNDGILQSDLDCAGFDLLNFSGGGTVHGIPVGGTTGQSLTKIDGTDYNTHWSTITGGGGGTASNPLITVNVKDAPYNAVGNGVADDTTAINAAIQAVFTLGGGTVFFPRGTYLCNGAFDGTTNSVLKVPLNSYGSNAISIELLGEIFGGWVGFNYANISAIKTTKTPSGTYPALLATNQYYGGGITAVPLFSNVMLRIKNLDFFSGSNSGVRLETCGWAVVENVKVWGVGGGTTVPAANSVGLWMPNTGNFALTYANNCVISGYDIAVWVGEHFVGPNLIIGSSNTGLRFGDANESSHVHSQFIHCVHNIDFSGYHSIDMFADIEHADPAAEPAFACTADIYDPSNWGGGMFRYNIILSNTGIVETNALVTGGGKINRLNLHRGELSIASSGALYLGTDARFTSVSGGVKLEARNTGTNTWIEAARWTNP